MMTNQHPITPPPELLDQWCMDATLGNWRDIATQAARWGADQELEACVNYIDNNMSGNKAREFRAIRRPKPPRLKEQALAELVDAYDEDKIDDTAFDTIRRALEALD